jgi:hypothetical protein
MSNSSITGMFRDCLNITAMFVCAYMFSGCNDGPSKPQPVDSNLRSIRLTEIHYHPKDLGSYIDDSLEFIELKNTGTSLADLSRCKFTNGIDFTFPEGSTIQANGFFVIASSVNAFNQRYGFKPHAVYKGQLKNSGETIELTDVASTEVLISQTYADTGAWPKEADGDGYSLVPVKINPEAGETQPQHWRSSIKLHGSPGADDVAGTFNQSLYDIRLTEIHYHPFYTDTIGEDSLEFIELKNVGTGILDLTGVVVSGGIEYQFADGATMQPGAFIVLAAKRSWFKQRYGFDAFGAYSGQLKNSSETITIAHRTSATDIISVTYADGNPWPAEPDGEGRTLVPLHNNPTREEQVDPASWRASFRIHGSPGQDDPEAVLVNEIISHTDAPMVDAIELYNPNKVDCNIGGWYLSDDQLTPAKFRIPDGTIIKAESYLVYYATDFNKDPNSPTSFALSENGDEVFLSADSSGCAGYCHGFDFGALERGVSFGRYIIPSSGNETFVPFANVSLGSANSEPLVGPLVISEIMTHSTTGTTDFIEITNIGNAEVMLYDQKYPDNTWRIQIDDFFFKFPAGKSIKTGESVVIICGTATTDEFRAAYNVAADVQLFNFYSALPDSSVKLELEKPMEPDKDSTSGTVVEGSSYKHMEVDRVTYKNKAPWPLQTTANGMSLIRTVNTNFSNDPANWQLKNATPGVK